MGSVESGCGVAGSLQALDLTTNTPAWQSPVTLGFCSDDVVVSADGDTAWVSNEGTGSAVSPEAEPGSVTEVSGLQTSDPTTTTLLEGSGFVGANEAEGVALSPNGDDVYVLEYGGGADNQGSIVVLNASTGATVGTIDNSTLGSNAFDDPEAITVGPDGTIYVANQPGGISDTDGVSEDGRMADDVAEFSPQSAASTVVAITPNSDEDGGTVVGTVTTGNSPWSMTLSPDGSELYVSDLGFGDHTAPLAGGGVYEINTDNMALANSEQPLFAGSAPAATAISSDGQWAFSATNGEGLVLSPTSLPVTRGNAGPISDLGVAPSSVVIDGDQVYTVDLADSTPVILTFTVAPGTLSISPASGVVGSQVTITGLGLDDLSSATIGGQNATIDSQTFSSVTLTVPAPSGSTLPNGPQTVVLTSPGGSDTNQTFTYAPGVFAAGTANISGTAVFGQTLTASTSQWPAGVTLSYQWNANGQPITGATGQTLKLTSNLVGEKLTVTVTGSEADFTSSSATSSADTVAAASLQPVTPTISGTAKFGNTLTAEPGSWPAGVALSYQWNANGKAITGATGQTLKLTSNLVGEKLTVTVTGSEAGFTSSSASSSADAVKAATLKTGTPKISGTAKVGKTLQAKPGTWTSGTKFSYRWYANGKAISKSTHVSLKLTKALSGKRITVKVTGTKSGYATATKDSKATTIKKA